MPKQGVETEHVQFQNFSLDNLRGKVSGGRQTLGRLHDDRQKYINNIINSFSLTQEYYQTINELLQQSQPFGVDRVSLKDSFNEGLFIALRLSEKLIGPISETSFQTIKQDFVSHCYRTTDSFKRMQSNGRNKAVFNSIISRPHFYEPEVLEKLSTKITDVSYFSTAVLKTLITMGVQQQTMSEKAERFDELVAENNIPKSDINSLRNLFLKNRPDPLSELAKQKEKKRKKPTLQSQRTSLNSLPQGEKTTSATPIAPRGISRPETSPTEKLRIIEQMKQKYLSEDEFYNDWLIKYVCENYQEINMVEKQLAIRYRQYVLGKEFLEKKYPKFSDLWILRYFIGTNPFNYKTEMKKSHSLYLQYQEKGEAEKGLDPDIADEIAKRTAIYFPNNFEVMLQQKIKSFKELEQADPDSQSVYSKYPLVQKLFDPNNLTL